MSSDCPFCEIDKERVVLDNECGVVLWDKFPVARGHALVVPRQHVASLFDLPPPIRAALWELVSEARQIFSEQFMPNGFNIGVNDGLAAGQTVMHAHIHVIPRYHDDVVDPRGGIRWIVPEKARYW